MDYGNFEDLPRRAADKVLRITSITYYILQLIKYFNF